MNAEKVFRSPDLDRRENWAAVRENASIYTESWTLPKAERGK